MKPWLDAPLHADCNGPMVTTGEGLTPGMLRCCACGADVEVSAEVYAQAKAADDAWEREAQNQ